MRGAASRNTQACVSTTYLRATTTATSQPTPKEPLHLDQVFVTRPALAASLAQRSRHGYYGHMKRTRIAELKNNLSRFLDQVRHGETVLVIDRDQPIAQIVPLQGRPAGRGADQQRLARLERRGLIRRGSGRPPDWLGKRKPPRLGRSLLRDLLAERESGW